MAEGIGLSVGATTLRAVAVGRSAVTRSPVLTRYPHRPSEVGVPSENPNLVERGLIITDFVDRVGDPVAIVAPDGSSHRAETVLADALRALLHTVTGGRAPTEPVGVTHPAHWSPTAVEALRVALAAQPDLRDARLTSDALTALTALQADPGLPTRGVVALCDVGGTGASITLADAADGFRPLGPTVRYPDLSGDLIDQALLTRVVGDLGKTGALDLSGTSAIGSLSRLRGQCRAAKERLSTSAVTSMPVDLPGNRTEVRITRVELDDAIRAPLDGFVDTLQDSLGRSGIRSGDLVAVASVGGGARLPILTTTLSEHLRVAVVTSARPELAAAIGGGVSAVRALVPDGVTSVAPAAPVVPFADPLGPPGSSTFRALAWSDAGDLPEPVPADPSVADDQPFESYEPPDPRPQLAFTDHDHDDAAALAPLPWYRKPAAVVAVGLLAAAAVIATAAFYVLRDDESSTPGSTTTSGDTATTAPTSAPPSSADTPLPESQAPDSQAPNPQTVTEQAPPPVVTVTEQPPPVTETSPPPPPPTTDAPTTQTTQTTQPPSSTQAPIIPTLPYQTIPGLPFVPAPIQPAQP